jgi:hypothetical protein
MPSTNEELLIQLTLDNKKLNESVRKAEASIGNFASSVKSKLEAAVGVLSVGLIANWAKNLVTSFADAGSKVYFLSKQINESVTTLGAWGQAAKRMGGTAEGVNQSITGLFNKLQEARFMGANETTGLLSYLGINPLTTKGEVKKTTDIMLDLADKFKGMDSGKQQFFGAKLGFDPATIQLMAQGRKALQQQLAEEQRRGVITDKQAQKAVLLKNDLQDLGQTWDRLAINLGEKLMPIARDFSKWAQSYISQHSPQIISGFEKLANFIEKLATEYIPQIITQFDAFSNSTGITIGDLGKLLAAFLALKAATSIFKELAAGITLLTSPITAAVAGLLALSKVWEDMQEKRNNPAAFNKKMKESLNDKTSYLNQGLQWLKDKTGIDMTVDGNKKAQPSMWDSIIDKLAPAFAHVESSGGKNINSGNGAYGAYQVRPRWGNAAWKKAGGEAHDAAWYMNPENSYATYKLMMKQNLQSTGGDLDAAVKMYSGGNYGADKILSTAKNLNSNSVNPSLIGIGNRAPQQLAQAPQQPRAAQVMNPPSVNTANNKNTNVAIQNLNLPNVNNPQAFFEEMKKNSEMGWAYSNPRLA